MNKKGYFVLEDGLTKYKEAHSPPENYICDAPIYPKHYPSFGEIYCSDPDCVDFVDTVIDPTSPDITIKEAKIRFDKLMLKRIEHWRRTRYINKK